MYYRNKDLNALTDQLAKTEEELEGRWRRVFSSLGYDLDGGDLCIMGDIMRGTVRVPQKYKESIVFSRYARDWELYFVDSSMKLDVPSIYSSEFKKQKEEG